MSIVTYPLDGILYSAADAELYNSTRTSGVYAMKENLDFNITGAREITISPGMAWIKNDEFAGKAVAVKDPVVVQFDEPNSVLDRIDRIVLRFSLAENGSSVVISKGIEASTPVAPARSTSPDLYELVLYDVFIPHGLVELTSANVTDQRGNKDLCGLMDSGVSGLDDYLLKSDLEAMPPWPITKGGTGANTALDALKNLGGMGVTYFDGTMAVDANNLIELGVYFFQHATGVYTNLPPNNGGLNGWLLVLPDITGKNAKQIWYRMGSEGNQHNTYVRTIYGYNGTISDWAKVMTSKDFTLTNGVLHINTL